MQQDESMTTEEPNQINEPKHEQINHVKKSRCSTRCAAVVVMEVCG
jgi:hypothetical protein